MKSIVFAFLTIATVGTCIAQKNSYKVELNEPGDSTRSGTMYVGCGNFFEPRLYSRPMGSSGEWKRVKDTKGLQFSCKPDEAVISGAESGVIVIFPTKSHITVNVLFQGEDIGSITYDMKSTPQPSVRIAYGKKYYDPAEGLPRETKKIELEAYASDPYFASARKKDATYSIAGFTLTSKKNSVVIGEKYADLVPLNLNAGDTLYISAVKIKRTNYQGAAVVAYNRFSQYVVIR